MPVELDGALPWPSAGVATSTAPTTATAVQIHTRSPRVLMDSLSASANSA